MFRAIININRQMSSKFDSAFFSEDFRLSGEADFVENAVPKYLREGFRIYDVGGGKKPYLSVEKKDRLKATVIGIDISGEELANAPKGAYDDTRTVAIECVVGKGDGDLVICEAVLEHVVDTRKALAGICSLLKQGGIALIFVPSRNAIYARLNLILPDRLKKILLSVLFPKQSKSSGFPAYYNECTPKRLAKISEQAGLEVIEDRYYYWSSYFSICFPVYVIWRLWLALFYALVGTEASEGMFFALKKRA